MIDNYPDISQKRVAEKLGISLDRSNYCLKELVDIGHVKVS